MNIEAIPLVAAIVAGVVPCALLWIAIVRQRAETNEAHVNLMIRLRTMEVEHLNLVRGIECTEILAKEERVRLEQVILKQERLIAILEQHIKTEPN